MLCRVKFRRRFSRSRERFSRRRSESRSEYPHSQISLLAQLNTDRLLKSLQLGAHLGLLTAFAPSLLPLPAVFFGRPTTINKPIPLPRWHRSACLN